VHRAIEDLRLELAAFDEPAKIANGPRNASDRNLVDVHDVEIAQEAALVRDDPRMSSAPIARRGDFPQLLSTG